MTVLNGIPINRGITFGSVVIKHSTSTNYLSSEEIYPEQEVIKYMNTIHELEKSFLELKENTADTPISQDMIALYIALLNDHIFRKQIPELILEKKTFAQHALILKIQEIEAEFNTLKNNYFRSRFADIHSIGDKILNNLNGDSFFSNINEPAIIVAKHFSAIELLQVPSEKVLGIITEVGGLTSHAAILSESLCIPTIFGVKDIFSHLNNSSTVIMDSYIGKIIIDPDTETVEAYKKLKERHLSYEEQILEIANQPSLTKDNIRFSILGNAGNINDVSLSLKNHADGTGLLRTEVALLVRDTLISEEEQEIYYQELIQVSEGQNLTIRTVDFGGDKFSRCLGVNPSNESNPFMGARSTRMLLKYPTELKKQLRAIIKSAKGFNNIRIMFPFITTTDEFLEMKKIYLDIFEEVRGHRTNDIMLGVMIEIPSLALTIEHILPHVDFVSIGTNDLTQYTLAVDRANHNVAHYFQCAHPAVLQLIKHSLDETIKVSKDISMCGEMAKEMIYTRLLLGMGLRRFSLPPIFIPMIKYILLKSDTKECEQIWNHVKTLTTTQEINDYLRQELNQFLQDNGALFEEGDIFGIANQIH